MRISRLAVTNFRNFRDLVIDPFPLDAVVVGENGIGKSNLLYALRLVLDPDLPDSARKLRGEDICESGPQLVNGVEVRVEIDLADIDEQAGEHGFCDDCFVSLDPLVARLTYVFRPRLGMEAASGDLSRDDYEWRILGGLEEHDAPRRFRDDVPLSILPPLRDAVQELSRWRGSPLQDLLEARPPSREVLTAAATGVQEVMDTLAADPQLTSVADDLGDRLTKMAGPRLDVTPTLGFASSVPERLLRSIRLFIDKDRKRSVGETSTGSANVIYLCLLLERLASRAAGGDIVSPMLAVEEPEAHLHPVLQRKLFRYLLHSETPLVVTTHSPHIAAVTRLRSLILLRSAENTGGTVAACAGHADLADSEVADLERYLDTSRAELLFCSAAILVEGASETYLVPALAAALGFDLDTHGVIVANISGTNFAPYRRLLAPEALNIPHVVITDGDPDKADLSYPVGGLKRAVKLAPALEELLESADVTEARRIAMSDNLFIGLHTLEPDLAPLLADAMILAHRELAVTSEALVEGFDAAVRALAAGVANDEQRKEVLRRIKAVSKGRYAQRLAGHVEDHLPEALVAALKPTDNESEEADTNITAERLLCSGSYGYILAALDRVSWLVRGYGLALGRESSTGEVLESDDWETVWEA